MTLTDPSSSSSSGDDAQSVWSLIGDLSQQLNANRAHVTSLQAQLDALKGKSIHSHTGYALRRFNTDVSKEKFESELERWNVALVQENNELKWENKVNDKLVKEYEQCLEVVMHKFRTFAHSSQVHALRLTQYYEDLIASRNHHEASSALQTSTAVTATLSHLGDLVRGALREVEGEGGAGDEGYDLDGGDDVAHPHVHAASSSYGSTDPRWYGSGGYTGKQGDVEAQRSDLALERSVEMARLRFENEQLRRVLELSEGKGLDVGFGKEKLSLGLPRRGRRAMTARSDDGEGDAGSVAASAGSSVGSVGSDGDDGAGAGGDVHAAPPSTLPAIPSAPLPTASIQMPSTTTLVPPPTPPAPRASLQERMSQAFEAMKRGGGGGGGEKAVADTEKDTAAASVAGPSTNANANTTASTATVDATTPSTSTPSPLAPPPTGSSAAAQSDIRSAPVLPVTESEGGGEEEVKEEGAGQRGDEGGVGAMAVDDAGEGRGAAEAADADGNGDGSGVDPALSSSSALLLDDDDSKAASTSIEQGQGGQNDDVADKGDADNVDADKDDAAPEITAAATATTAADAEADSTTTTTTTATHDVPEVPKDTADLIGAGDDVGDAAPTAGTDAQGSDGSVAVDGDDDSVQKEDAAVADVAESNP